MPACIFGVKPFRRERGLGFRLRFHFLKAMHRHTSHKPEWLWRLIQVWNVRRRYCSNRALQCLPPKFWNQSRLIAGECRVAYPRLIATKYLNIQWCKRQSHAGEGDGQVGLLYTSDPVKGFFVKISSSSKKNFSSFQGPEKRRGRTENPTSKYQDTLERMTSKNYHRHVALSRYIALFNVRGISFRRQRWSSHQCNVRKKCAKQ